MRQSLYPAAAWYARRVKHRGLGGALRMLHPTDEAAARYGVVRTVPFERGLRLTVDTSNHVGRVIYFHGAYRPECLAAVRSHMPAGSVGVDVGTAVGDFTVVMAHAAGADGAVHAFEPWPPELERCRANLELNGLTNVVLNRMAVADHDGEATFIGSNGDNQSGGFLRAAAGASEAISCETVRLDSYLREASRLDFMKIDAQGADLLVLRGAEQCIERWRPAILLTSCQEGVYARFGTSIAEVTEFLAARGYRVRWLSAPSRLPRILRPRSFAAALFLPDGASRPEEAAI